MTADRPYFLTTPIYYVNDLPHLGHAYTTVACDVLARFMRLDGRNVRFLTGTDEHGQKVERSAQARGQTPQEFADEISGAFRDMGRLLNISNDDYIRTTEPRHIARRAGAVAGAGAPGRDLSRPVRRLVFGARRGLLRRERADRRPNGKARADRGRGRMAGGGELLFPAVGVAGPAAGLVRRASRRDRAAQPPQRGDQLRARRAQGPVDVAHQLQLGHPGAGRPAHVIYVWLDALTNYITALGYPGYRKRDFSTFWPADLHMVGKDILRFHTVYWHAFLMAAGIEPPRRVFAHGWWTVEGQKMSKSLGNFIPPHELVDQYGLDPVRYFMLRELPFGSDGDFSHRAMVGRLNGDLANDFGNLAQRVLVDDQPQLRRAVPEPGRVRRGRRAAAGDARGLLDRVRPLIAEQAFHLALETIWRVVGDANRYVDEQAPWALRRSDPARMATVLYTLAEVLRHLAILTQPFVPGAAAALLDQLAVPAERAAFRRPWRQQPCRRARAAGAARHLSALRRSRSRGRLRAGGYAGRQPLPSRFPGFRRPSAMRCSPAPAPPASARC